MYVCLCNKVTDGAIRRAAGRGNGTLEEIREELGVSSRCGRCACLAQEILDEVSDDGSGVDFSLPFAAA